MSKKDAERASTRLQGEAEGARVRDAATADLRSGRSEALSVIAGGVVAVGVIATMASIRVLDTFRPAGFAWQLPVDARPVEATVGAGAHSVVGVAEALTMVSTDVDSLTTVAAIASIAIWTLAALTVVGCVVHLAWSFLRGRVFAASTARDLDIVCWTLACSGALTYLCDHLVRSTLLASLGVDEARAPFPLGLWACWAIGITAGLLAVAFRRGIRLQRDTEGLV